MRSGVRQLALPTMAFVFFFLGKTYGYVFWGGHILLTVGQGVRHPHSGGHLPLIYVNRRQVNKKTSGRYIGSVEVSILYYHGSDLEQGKEKAGSLFFYISIINEEDIILI